MEQGQLNWIANFIWGIADRIESGTCLLYDGTCGTGGTGGMLTVAEEMLQQFPREHRKGQVQLIDATQWFKPLRTLEESRADILAVEKETEGLLGEIVGGGGRS